MVLEADHAARIAGRAQKNRLGQGHGQRSPDAGTIRLFPRAVCTVAHISRRRAQVRRQGRGGSSRAALLRVSTIDTRALRCEHGGFTHQQRSAHAEAQTRADLDRPSPYAGRYQPRPSPGFSTGGAGQATSPRGKGTKRTPSARAAEGATAHAQKIGGLLPFPIPLSLDGRGTLSLPGKGDVATAGTGLRQQQLINYTCN